MDATTLVLAVDSSQVNSASTALQRMAGEGAKAESVSTKLTSAAAVQGKTLATGLVPAATKAATAYDGIVDASKELAATSGKPTAALLGGVTQTNSALSETAAEAGKATTAVQALNAAVAAVPAARPVAALLQAPRTTTVQEIAQTPVADRAVSYREFLSDRMGPLRQQYKEEGMPNQEAHAKAIRRIADEWREYKRTLDGIVPSANKVESSISAIAAAAVAGGAAAGIAGTSSALSEAAAQANAAAAAMGNMKAQASKPAGNFNPFGSLGNGAQIEEIGKKAKLSKYEAQQLSFQMNDLFVQLASGASPMTAIIQQGSQLNGTFGGVKGTIEAIGSLITPMRLGLAGVAVGLGALGAAYISGTRESRAFNDALVLTGGYAGKTESQIGEMAKKIANSTRSSVSDVREMITELAKTGKIKPINLEIAAEVAVRYANADSSKDPEQARKEAIGLAAKIAKSPVAAIDDLNSKGANLFSAAERAAVKELQVKGDNEAAAAAVFAKVQQRYTKLDDGLDTLSKAAQKASSIFSQFVDYVKDRVTSRTGDSTLQSVEQIANTGISVDFSTGTPRPVLEQQSVVVAAQKEVEKVANKEQEKRIEVAKEAAKTALQVEAEESRQKGDPLLQRARPSERLKTANKELDAIIDGASKGDKPYTAAEIKAMRFQTLKDNIDPEIGQMASATYSTRVQSFKDALEKEQAALSFHNQFQQNLYQAGAASLDKLYDTKVENIRKGVTAEVNELEKEKRATQELLKSVIDPAQRLELQARIKRFDVEKGKVRDRGNYDESLTEQERAAAQRSQADAVDNFRANLKQGSGDEFGAALLRAQVAERQSRVLAGQSGGKITQEDIDRQTALTKAAAEFNDVQRQAGFLAQSAARAQEATFMAADLGGKSLRETEDAIYAVRVRELEQLGALAAKAAELAKESTRPEVKQYAADLALAYAKAAAALDPALQRLQAAQKEIAAGIANTLNQGIATLPQAYSSRRQEVNQDVKDDKDRYNRRIDNLESYLANATAKTDRARIQQKIKDLEAERDRKKGESKGSSLLKAANENILQPMASGIFATVNKLLVTDPLQKYIEGQLKGLTEGNGAIAKSLKDALGIKDAKVDPKVLAEQAAATATDTLKNSLTAQTGAVDASRLALEGLANAANAAAGTVGGGNSKPLTVETGSRQAAPSMGDFTRADRALSAAQATPEDTAATAALVDARSAVEVMGTTSKDAAVTVTALAQAAGKGGGALGLLPSIVNLFQAAVSAMNLSSAASGGGGGGGGGMLGSIASLFGSSGGATAASTNASALAPEAADIITSFIFHKGGVVGGSAMSRGTPSSVFANAPRYHTGGIVGQKADGARAALAAAALKHGEVPAILMKNEEVLRADDPRHRSNLGSEVFAKIMQSKGENSASVLQGLLTRLGVKDDEPAVSSALKVHGARELGGPVSAGKLYRVNEKRPELLNVGNKQYLMMGAQGGSVDPNPGARAQGGQVQQLHVTVAMPQGGNAATANQFGVIAGRQMQNALRRNG